MIIGDLLTDYPAAQQQQILDYLFKPGYGADLQILKVEVGGDTNSTDGSESSIEHASGSVSCGNGYEFWLMEQARARNPGIKLYGLAWGAPGWIGGGNFWSTDMINYLVSWLNCARSDGLTISYLGGWNERGYNISWYEQLRSTLNAGGNLSWSNYTVSADALMKQAGSVQLLGRAGTQHSFGPAGINEYYLQLSNTGAWSIIRNSTSDTLTTLASGTVTAPGTGTWQHLALTFNGATIAAAINGTTVGTVTDSSYASGMVGLGTSGYQTDQFDNLSVTLAGSATPTGHIVAGDDTAECADVNAGSAAPGTKVQMWACGVDL